MPILVRHVGDGLVKRYSNNNTQTTNTSRDTPHSSIESSELYRIIALSLYQFLLPSFTFPSLDRSSVSKIEYLYFQYYFWNLPYYSGIFFPGHAVSKMGRGMKIIK